jgi:hypothetical protein
MKMILRLIGEINVVIIKGKTMKYSRYDPPFTSYDQWKSICSEGTWRVISPTQLDVLLPDGILNKTNSIFIISSGSTDGSSVFVANLNRIDKPYRAIDQTPFIAAFDHSGSIARGGFIQHGNWRGRTTYPGDEFFNIISASGIQAYYPLTEMPISGSGINAELHVDSQHQAFWTSVDLLKKNI